MMLTMLFQLLAAFPIAGLVAASPVAEVASYQCARGCGAFYDRCLTLAGHDKEVYCRHMQCKFYSIYVCSLQHDLVALCSPEGRWERVL
jgi:hypothetical protein